MGASLKPIYLALPTVAAVVSLSEAQIQKLVREEQFPRPRMLSGRRVGWLLREIEDWAEARPVSNLLPPPNTGHSNRGAAVRQARGGSDAASSSSFASTADNH